MQCEEEQSHGVDFYGVRVLFIMNAYFTMERHLRRGVLKSVPDVSTWFMLCDAVYVSSNSRAGVPLETLTNWWQY